MEIAVLTRIEADIDQLPLSDQLWLMERDLAAMASDPDIQRELRQIEYEFAGTCAG